MSRQYTREDLIGKVFGRLTVISLVQIRPQRWDWLCRCECGQEKAVTTSSLKKGTTQSCGCLQIELTIKRSTKHGFAPAKEKSRIYRIWCGMLTRCTNPNCRFYNRYGGRGVTVCDRWRESFQAFLDDMGESPSPKHSIDRVPNHDGNYEPGNCRWATSTEQARNKRNNRILEFNGESKTVMEWSETIGIHWQTILFRLKHGWSIKDTLTKQPHVAALLTHNGITMTLREWSKVTGIKPTTLRGRVNLGWPPERILER